MRSFADLDALLGQVPAQVVGWLSAIEFGRGSEALNREQMPGLLTELADRARVQSITASSAIEGVIVRILVAQSGSSTGRRRRSATEASRNWRATATPRTTCSSTTGAR
jgi:hypothetical protein